MTVLLQSVLAQQDPAVYAAIQAEEERQRSTLVLIASENYASRAVMEAQASAMTNKYAEGYPGRRYYGGCEFVDVAERLAIERLKALYGAQHANVQPHSGVQANMAVYFAFLQPGDVVMGMRLDQGGHLSHGSPVSFSGKTYEFVSYGVRRDTELIDYDQVRDLARERRPKLIIAGASSYPRAIDFPVFRAVADEIGALLVVDMAHYAGLIAAGIYPDPVPHAQVVTSTTHKTLRGPRGAFILSDAEHAADIDKAVFPGVQGGPMMHTIAAKAVAFGEALRPEFKSYQRQVLANAQALADELQGRGLRIVSGGTDSHMLLVDLTPLNVTGRDATKALEAAGIIVNANAIPYDPRPPRVASGVRIGTPAVTSRGLTETDVRAVAGLIDRVLRHIQAEEVVQSVREQVREMTHRFPVPGLDL
ncbi:MAG: serine hydroxymethyltransferase [Chloroflexi bacterium]|nr:serine hydroxymethyltransferase [Chloroflexota bacterium]